MPVGPVRGASRLAAPGGLESTARQAVPEGPCVPRPPGTSPASCATVRAGEPDMTHPPTSSSMVTRSRLRLRWRLALACATAGLLAAASAGALQPSPTPAPMAAGTTAPSIATAGDGYPRHRRPRGSRRRRPTASRLRAGARARCTLRAIDRPGEASARPSASTASRSRSGSRATTCRRRSTPTNIPSRARSTCGGSTGAIARCRACTSTCTSTASRARAAHG